MVMIISVVMMSPIALNEAHKGKQWQTTEYHKWPTKADVDCVTSIKDMHTANT